MAILGFLLSSAIGRIAVAVVGTALIAFPVGFLKGWGYADRQQLLQQVEDAQAAAAEKERLAQRDAARAVEAEAARVATEAKLEELINDSVKDGGCRLSAAELKRLQQLAGRRS